MSRDAARVRRMLVALAAVGAACLIALVPLTERVAEKLPHAIERALGRRVSVERIVTRLPSGVRLEGVRVAEDPAFGSDEPFLTAPVFEVRLAVLPLLRGRIVIDRVILDRPLVNLVRDAQGRLNASTLGAGGHRRREPAARDRTAGAARAAERSAEHPARGIVLAALRVRGGTLRYREHGRERPFELTDVDLDAPAPSLAGPTHVSLRGRIVEGDLRLDALSSEGVVEQVDGEPEYRGTIEAGPGAIGPIRIAALVGRLHVRAPTLSLEPLRAEVLGSAVTGGVRLTSRAGGGGIEARLDGRDLDLSQLEVWQDGPHVLGTLALWARLSGPVGEAAAHEALVGEGRFEVSDGCLVGLPLSSTVRATLEPVVGGGRFERVASRHPDLLEGDVVHFTRFAGTARLDRGRVRSDDLALEGTTFAAAGAGSIGMDGGLDVTLDVTASAELTQALLGRSAAGRALTGGAGRLAIPLRVHGNAMNPKVITDPDFSTRVVRTLVVGTEWEDIVDRVLGKHKPTRTPTRATEPTRATARVGDEPRE
jgi:AsmA-like C-terminal region/AsmA family